MATYYLRNIIDTLYYSESTWPTDSDTSTSDIEAAINAIGAGNTLVLASDTYEGTQLDATDGIEISVDNFILRSALNTDPDYEIYGGQVILGPDVGVDFPTIRIANRTDVEISGNIIVKGPDSVFGAILLTGTLDTIVIDGLTVLVEYATRPGIYSTSVTPTDCTIKNCKVYNDSSSEGSGQGISIITNSIGWIIEDNIIGESGRGFESGILLSDTSDTIVRRNTISYCWDEVIYPSGVGHGIKIIGSSSSNQIYANSLYYNNKGIFLQSSSGTAGNIIYYNLVSGSQVNGIDIWSSVNDQELIYQNTVIHTPSGVAGHGIAVQGTGKEAKIYNNIIYSHTTVENAFIQCISLSGVITNVELDYNSYFISGDAYLGRLNTTDYTTLSEWQTAISTISEITIKDPNTIEDDQLLIDSGKLKVNSPCIDSALIVSGINDNNEVDIWGNITNETPNIGAYQGTGEIGEILILNFINKIGIKVPGGIRIKNKSNKQFKGLEIK